MPEEFKAGCARPTGGPVGEKAKPGQQDEKESFHKKEERHMIMVGQKAPDFVSPAYHKGKFVNIKLSEYLVNGYCSVFIPVILPSFERRKFRQLPKNLAIFKSWELRFFL